MADPVTSTCGAKVVEDLVGRILNFILNPIPVAITFVRDCGKNVKDLKDKVSVLKGRKGTVEGYINYVNRKGEVINEEFQTWLDKAVELIEAAEELEVRGEEVVKKKCFFGLRPNLLPRYKLSKEAKQSSDHIATHVLGARDFNIPPSLPLPPPPGVAAAPVEGFEEFPSRIIVLDQIMEALRSSTVNTIGVYGLSGVGKTMLVKEVRRKAVQDGSFSAVVMAKVTKKLDLDSIRDDIARDLGMDQISPDQPPRRVADRIKTRLIERKKFLVILDDVWEPGFDLESIGIPSVSEMKQNSAGDEGSSAGDGVKLRKILLSSRDRDVLSRTMEAEKVFEVPKLKTDEAWSLFEKIVGNSFESPAIKSKAEEIVERCLGLPIAIASVGNALKDETQEEEWETARKELGKPTPEGMSAHVYKPIEFSYNSLRAEELKKTFILCSLLGHDFSIDDLLKYGMGLDLFDKVNTMEDGWARGLTLVRRLKLSSLLVGGRSSLHFDMHDQIREVALSVASRDYHVFAAVDEDARKKWPDKGSMEKLEWIYMSNADIKLPSNGLQCPHLAFFHLSGKCSAVPPELFTMTVGLKVLCWTKIDMPSPIPSIPANIQSLILDRCVFKVEDLGAIMGNLENLEVLSLAGCDIEELPREIEKLSKLKLLDVSDCTQLRVIPRQVLASLSRSLEELKMGNSFDQWDVEEGNARFDELAELHKLTALEVGIANLRAVLFPANLKRFKIFVGGGSYHRDSSFESSNIMKLELQGVSITSSHSIKNLLKKTEELHLKGLNGVENLVDELDDEGFQHLKCLHVQNAPDIRCIFNPAGGWLPSHVFPILEVLTLLNLEKMEKICHDLTGAAPFKVLRKITVVGCDELKNLFYFTVARQLQQLQEITVENCSNIEEIIDDVEEQGNGNDIVEESEGCKLGSLRSLTLKHLPKLISFNSSNCSGISLFNDKVMFPKLEELELRRIKINQLWITSSCVVTPQENLNFGKLRRLQISACSSLEYIFTPSMVSGLVQLEDLDVDSCEDLKQVIMVKGVEEVVNTTELIFPRLKSISLRYCDNLSSFCAGSNAFKFQSAIKISIAGCRNMTTFASTFSTEKEKGTTYRGTEGRLGKNEPDICSGTFFYDTVDIPLLDELHLHDIDAQQIWHSQITSMPSFVQNLRKLTLWYCYNLKCLFTSSMVKSFEQLEVLSINECKEMQVVILVEELEEKERKSQIMFPKLDNLELSRLPQLIRFCSNYNSLGEGYEAQGLIGSGSQVLAATQSNLVETEVTQYEFPQVTYLRLNYLPNFKGFFPQIHITKWPLLKEMCVEQCDEMKTFASEFPSNEKAYGDSQLKRQTQHPMFWISKDSFPCLEQLELKQNGNMKEIWRGQYPGVYFPKLKDFKLLQFQFQNCSALLPSFTFFFQTLPSLEKLDVSKASFHEIFQCERLRSEGRPAYTPSWLRKLKLSKLNALMHLWKEESELKSIFHNLKTLKVLKCIKLVNLVPSVVSFENLQTLEISKCHGLENLVSYSTAKSLEQLKRMSITDCDLLEEIVKCMEDNVKDGIVFSQLKCLQLSGLPKLSSFCTRKCDFEFPSLKEVIVIGCPQMKCFSLGKTVTEELQNVQWINDEEKGHWVGDLNSTIQDLFTQKVGYLDQHGELRLSKFSEVEIWRKNPEELALPSKKLQCLKVSNCSRLSYLLTPSMALSLVQLKDLEVKYCAAMEKVIMVTGVGKVVETGLIFP